MKFDYEHIKESLKPRLKEYMEGQGITFNRQNKCKCILPGHDDSDRKPNMSYDNKTNKVKCFKCNNKPIDLYGVIEVLKGYTEFNDQFKEACRFFNIQNPYDDKPNYTNNPKTQKTALKTIEPIKIENNTKSKLEEHKPEELASLNEYIDKARGNIEDKDCIAYLKSRGIENIDLMKKYNMGYSINTYEGNKFPSIITPTSIDSQFLSFTGFTRRQLIPGITKDGDTIDKGKNGASGIFNLKALYQSEKPVFICEGEFNALSILEVTGGEIEGVATGSVGNTQTFIDLLKLRRPEAFIILELDDDYKKQTGESIKGNRGKEEQLVIEEYLKQANISFLSVNTVKACKMPDDEDKSKFIQCKDQNDALTYDRETFINEIENVLLEVKSIQEKQGENKMTTSTEPIKETKAPEQADNENNKKDYEGLKQAYIKKFLNDIEKFDPDNNINTNIFYKFDSQVGIIPGLIYAIGGVSSFGKTTFALQMADSIASTGENDVLFFSLEMSGSELIARSLSRISHIKNEIENKGLNVKNMSKAYKQAGGEEFEKFDNAFDYYKRKIKPKLYIKEGGFDSGIKEIIDETETYIKSTGNRPVVFIDYLQIISPDDKSKTERQDITANVKKLKILARDYDLPIIFISSFSRAYYYKSADMDAFKESGNIEYSCDVCLAIQKRGLFKESQKESQKGNQNNQNNQKEFDDNNPTREVEILILKNRWGKRYFTIDYDYIPEFHYLKEVDKKK